MAKRGQVSRCTVKNKKKGKEKGSDAKKTKGRKGKKKKRGREVRAKPVTDDHSSAVESPRGTKTRAGLTGSEDLVHVTVRDRTSPNQKWTMLEERAGNRLSGTLQPHRGEGTENAFTSPFNERYHAQKVKSQGAMSSAGSARKSKKKTARN